MCCMRFPISASYRKEVERHLKTAQPLGHVRQVKYRLAAPDQMSVNTCRKKFSPIPYMRRP